MEGKKSFIAYNDWECTFSALPDDMAGKLIKAVFAYSSRGDEPEDAILKALLANFKNTIERDSEKWDSRKKERSRSGILGNLKRYNPDLYEKVCSENMELNEAIAIAKSRKTSHSDTEQSPTVAKLAVNDSVSVSVSDNVNVNGNNNHHVKDYDDKPFKETVTSINEEKKILTPTGVQEFVDYWNEVDIKTKEVRWKSQDFFDPVKRMVKWANNNYSGKAKPRKRGERGAEFKNQVF